MHCWYQVAISRYVKVGHLCYCIYTCRTFPLYSVTTVRPKKIKALVEMGHPLTSCVSVECMLRVGMLADIRALVRVFTCPVRRSWCCVCERVHVY